MKAPALKALALVAAAALVTTPALAGKAKQKHHRQHGAYHHRVAPGDWRHSRNRYDPYAVYSYDGRLIGRDPDPNIRQSLRDEDWYFRYRD